MAENVRTTRQRGARRALSLWGFFNVGFGAVIGSCWLLLVGDWMVEGGGPVPVVIAFLLGMILMVPISSVFGELSAASPYSGGLMEFVAATHGDIASTLVSWSFALGNGIVPAWDALMLSVIMSDVVGALPGMGWICAVRLYSLGGANICLVPTLAAIAAVLFVGRLNMSNTFAAERLQLFLSYVQLVGMVAVLAVAVAYGSADNALPAFSTVTSPFTSTTSTVATTKMGGVLAVLAVTPFFYAGFDAIPQRAEEAAEGVNWNKFGKVTVLTLLASAGFYMVTAYSFGTMEPWREFVQHPYPAFSCLASLSPAAFAIVLVVAVFCPIGPMNSFVGATSFILASMGRRRQLPSWFAEIDPRTGTPRNACRVVVASGIIGPFLGTAMLAPLSKVASLALSISYLMVSMSCLRMRKYEPRLPRPFKVPGGRLGIGLACVSSLVCIAILVLPSSPASIGPVGWAIVGAWVLLGVVLHIARSAGERAGEAVER